MTEEYKTGTDVIVGAISKVLSRAIFFSKDFSNVIND